MLLMGVSIVLVLVAYGSFRVWHKSNAAQNILLEATGELETLRIEKAKLMGDLQYLLVPENLEKELKARFHFKRPGEKLIILVPEERRATTTSSTLP